jgi:hypothetical protein
MSLRHRISAHRLGVVLAIAFVALAGLATHAQASATSHSRVAARASAPARAAAISSNLLKATGHSASQLSTRAACGSAPAGRFRCYARVLTVKSSGKPVALLHAPRAQRTHPTGSASTSSPSTTPQEYTADYLQWAYDTTWLSANDGDNDTVAIVDAYGDSTAYGDMEQFRSGNGLPQIPTCGGSVTASCFEVVNQTGQTTNLPTDANDETDSWNIEESLDIDAVSSICPLCKILVVEAKSDDDRGRADLETAVSEAATLGANQISLSWGADVTPDASDYSSPYSSITSSAILAAAGDDTYPGPEVGYPAALPHVTAVGGTSLAASSGDARGFAESAWSVETCSGGTPCATESGCDTSQSIPPYQQGVTTDCDGRAYNDISADADPETGLEIYDSQSGDEGCGTSNNWCIVGGTSLATPLTAAFEAITSVPSATTPAWTYSSPYSSLLNDIVSGSDGSCSGVICNAGVGWDGPTGNGSIDGDVVAGGPGVGAQPDATNVLAASAIVSGEVNPNDSSSSADTSAYWQYGSTTSYGSTSTTASLPSGTSFQSTGATLSLSQPCTYHYRLVATNALGTVYGYDHTVTPTQTTTAPANTAAPSISGSPAIGEQLTAQNGIWSGVDCDTTYQWQEASSADTSSWTPISGATSATYTPTSSDAGLFLEVVVTETNDGGSTPEASAPTTQVPAPAVAATGTGITSTTTPTSPPTPTSTTTTTTPNPSGAATTTTTVRFYRCARTCTLINTHGAKTYVPQKADYGRYIKVVTTVARIAGNVETSTTSTRWVGPVTSATAGDISLGSGARVASATIVRGSAGKPLAQVRVAQHTAGKLTLVVRRETTARTQAWAFVVSAGRVVSSTTARSLGRPATFSFALKRGQTIRLVAVRT